MLSRRIIRIKVMQLLYASGRDETLTYKDLENRYKTGVKKTHELYLLNLHYLFETARFSLQDLHIRRSKHLPSDDDKLFSAKIYENELVTTLLQSAEYKKQINKYLSTTEIDEANIRLLYTEFCKNELYKPYIHKSDCTREDHAAMLLELYKTIYNYEHFNDLVEDHNAGWVDDKSLIVGAVKKTIKGLPSIEDFHTEWNEEDELTMEFGAELLTKSFTKDKELLGMIEPMLQNWDADRVAIIDMILIKMALCELLYFPTIPTKVTLNEFVEISKLYSTDKSKEFINGLLDRLMKKMSDDGRIQKEGRGLIDE